MGLGLLIVFGPQRCLRTGSSAMPSATQITLDKWMSGVLDALDLMNETNDTQNKVIVRLLHQLAEMDLTLQAIVQSMD